jgi:hypothetical protein
MSVYVASGEVHDQVNDGAEQRTIICSPSSPRPEDVAPELVTTKGFDEHL